MVFNNRSQEELLGTVQDITERRQNKLALQESEERLRLALDAAKLGIFDFDPSHNQIIWSQRLDEIFGFGPGEFGGRYEDFASRVYPEDLPRVDAELARSQTERNRFACEYRAVWPNGSTHWVSGLGEFSYDADGNVLRMRGVIWDITERKQMEETLLEAEALRQSEIKFRTLAEALPQIVWITKADGLTIYLNQHWVEYTGLTLEESYGHGWLIPFHPDDQKRTWEAWQNATKTDGVYSIESRLRQANGIYRWWLIRGVSLHDEKGNVVNWFGTCTDIQEIKGYEEKLQLAANVFLHSREGIVITDATATIVDVNAAFTSITGYTHEEAIGQNTSLLKSGRHGPEFYEGLWHDLTTKGHWYGEMWNRRKNGEDYAEMINISAVQDAKGQTQNYVALFSDITPIKEHQQQLEHIAHYDALTGLPNRLLLSDRLEQALAHAQRRGYSLAVAFLDFDGFKSINDLHGHSVGDGLLVAVAQRMKEALRGVDTLARIGGDEFVAVLVDLEDPQDCQPLIERLLRSVADPVTVGQTIVQVSASIGVTVYPKDEVNADQLLRHADHALYVAKQSGKNCYALFDLVQEAALKAEQESLAGVRFAMDRREFVLHYQPKVNLKTGAVIGAEALIRWQHPERGLLLPVKFLPIVEHHPYGIELGEWVIDAAFAQLSEWHEQNFDLPVSVNIAALHLQQDGFAQRLRERLAAHPEIRTDLIELEILESSALKDVNNAAKIMAACCEIGMRFALDDFGTGYSSLTYLRRLPVAILKIDQSFVRDMMTDSEDLAIIEGVIGLAKAFHYEVIAEGVEMAGHGERLLELGCDLAQGYAIAKPMPGAELPKWVAIWQQNGTWKDWQNIKITSQ